MYCLRDPSDSKWCKIARFQLSLSIIQYKTNRKKNCERIFYSTTLRLHYGNKRQKKKNRIVKAAPILLLIPVHLTNDFASSTLKLIELMCAPRTHTHFLSLLFYLWYIFFLLCCTLYDITMSTSVAYHFMSTLIFFSFYFYIYFIFRVVLYLDMLARRMYIVKHRFVSFFFLSLLFFISFFFHFTLSHSSYILLRIPIVE